VKPIITVENLSKTFQVRKHHQGAMSILRNFLTRDTRTIHAVDNVSFTVNEGEVVGYLGPNGAGKSTTIKMLTGLLVPSSGSLNVNGFVPWKERQRYVSSIGAVFGQRTTLWWDLPVIESLQLLQYIYKVSEATFKQNLKEFENVLELNEFISSPVRSLSLGQRMRADLCAALLHNPALLFLDEPTIGLDVVAKERIRKFIKHVNEVRETTVLLTTHDLSDVQKLCQRILIIDQGKLLFDGALDTLQNRFGGKWQLVVDFTEPYQSVEVAGAEVVRLEGIRAIYTFDRNRLSVSDLISRISAQYSVRDISVHEPEIEVTIRNIYEGKLLSPS
jgi:ABC-2 type transport system ATP-binding protein